MTQFPQHDIEYYFDTAHELAERVAAQADQIDEERQIPADLAGQIADKGLFRLLLPRSLGGSQLDHRDFLRILETFATADGSTGWCINQLAPATATSAAARSSAASWLWITAS